MEHYATYLKGKYHRLRLPVDDQWPPIKLDHYISFLLSLKSASQLQPEAEIQKDVHRVMEGRVEGIALSKTMINLPHILDPDSDGRDVQSVLVEGAPGIGKTAFSLTVCKEWARGNVFQSFKAVIYWSLQDLDVAKVTSVDDLFVHDSDEVRSEVIREVYKQGGRGVLFVLDGWDELPKSIANKRRSFLIELVKGSRLPLASVIVTSRPVQSQNLLQRSIHRSVEILGFSRANIREYISVCFQSNPSLAEKLLTQLSARPDLESICYIPMNCAIVCYVFSRKQQLPSTLTEFYSFLVQNCLLRNIQLREDGSDEVMEIRDLASIGPDVEKLFLAMCELAFRGLTVSLYTYTEEEVAAVCRSSPKIIVNIDHLGILQAVNIYHSTGIRPRFHFLHTSVQEFMAARFLYSLTAERQREFVSRYFTYANFRSVWQFFCGMAAHSLHKSVLLNKLCDSASEITSYDANLHDRFSDNESDFESDESSVAEEEYEDEDFPDIVSPSGTPVEGQEPTSSVLSASVADTTLPSPSLQLALSKWSPPPSPSLSIATATQEDDGDVVGSQADTDLGKLSGISLTLDMCTAVIPFEQTPAKNEYYEKGQLLSIVKCAYESQHRHFCIRLAGSCHKRLLFKNRKLTPVDSTALGYVISHSNLKWSLQLDACSISAQHLATLGHQLQHKHTGKLCRLYLCKNSLDALCIEELNKVAMALAPCEKLFLANNLLGDDGAKALGPLLMQLHQLTGLDVSGNGIHDTGVKQVCGALETSQTLTHLSLSANCITGAGVESVALLGQILTNLAHLDLGSNQLGDDGASSIAALLAVSSSLEYIDISHNNISSVGTAYLATAMMVNTSVSSWVLHSNPICADGAYLILAMLESNCTLQKLDISNCSIESTQALQDTFRSCLCSASLTALDIAYNCLGDAICSILEALTSSTVITDLNLTDNGIDAVGICSLGSFLCTSESLQRLAVAEYELICDQEAFDAICDCLVYSNTIEVLKIYDADNITELKTAISTVNEARLLNGKRKFKLKCFSQDSE